MSQVQSPPQPSRSPLPPYPDRLRHVDQFLGVVALLSLMAGATFLVVLIWESGDSSPWLWKSVMTMGILLLACIVGVAFNRMMGRARSKMVFLLHGAMELGVVACFIVTTLTIWGVTDSDVAGKAVATVFMLIIACLIGALVSRFFSSSG